MAMKSPEFLAEGRNKDLGLGLGDGVGSLQKEPTMAIECPMPGGTVTTMSTQPVQKATWGPIVRVEATQEAKDLVKQWTLEKEARKSRPTKNDKPKSKAEEGDTVDGAIAALQGKLTDKLPFHVTVTDGESANTSTSQADADATNAHRRLLRPPPPTPPDSVFYHSLSMPTLPLLHQISDQALVERYRLQRQTDTVAFDEETKAIKRALVEAKIARGGKNRLLKNEYTVELASREDAATSERWASGRVAQMRSRTNTLTQISEADKDKSPKMRGGEAPDTFSAAGEALGKHDGCWIADAEAETGTMLAALGPPAQDIEVKCPSDANPQLVEGTGDPAGSAAPSKLARRQLKDRLRNLDLEAHVSKITTLGSVRHQSSVTREINDHGEKRTVKTWIEVTEVLEVPSAAGLSLNDVATAIHQGAADDSNKKGTGKTRAKKGKRSQATARRGSKASKKTRGAVKTHPTASDAEDEGSDSDTESASDSEDLSSLDGRSGAAGEVVQGWGETGPGALYCALARLGKAGPDHIKELAERMRTIMDALDHASDG